MRQEAFLKGLPNPLGSDRYPRCPVPSTVYNYFMYFNSFNLYQNLESNRLYLSHFIDAERLGIMPLVATWAGPWVGAQPKSRAPQSGSKFSTSSWA